MYHVTPTNVKQRSTFATCSYLSISVNVITLMVRAHLTHAINMLHQYVNTSLVLPQEYCVLKASVKDLNGPELETSNEKISRGRTRERVG